MQISSTSRRSSAGKSRRPACRQAGFTLIELVVTITIMLVVMSIVLFNESHYTNGASVDAAAQDISLSLREAQVYGVSIKERTPGSNDFSSAYGVEFRMTGAGGSNDAYISFADTNANGVYGSGWSCPTTSSECLSKTTFPYGNKISKICSIASDGSESCNLGGFDATFLRPATDAHLVYFSSTGGQISLPGAVGVRVELVSTEGATSSASVYTSGQISVQ